MAEIQIPTKPLYLDLPSSGSSTGMAGIGQRGIEWWGDDAHQSIHTPGGYEWWNFESIDSAGNGINVILFEGLPFHPYYLARFARWRRYGGRGKLMLNPPDDVLPHHYPALYIGVYQGGERIAQALNVYPSGTFEGRSDFPELRIGPNRLTPRSDGSFGLVVRAYPYDIHRGTPRRRPDQILSAALTFVPALNGVQHVRNFRPDALDGHQHKWVIAAPIGTMSGRVQLLTTEADAETTSLIDFPLHQAPAYHDHQYGHSPLSEKIEKKGRGAIVKRIESGHLVADNFSVLWQRSVIAGQSTTPTDAILLFEKDRPPVIIEEPIIDTSLLRTTRWLVKYTNKMRMNGSDAKGNSVELALRHGPMLERSPFHVRLKADVSLTIPGRHQYTGTGYTHVMQYQRLGWPLLSDLVLNSIQEIARDDPLWRQ